MPSGMIRINWIRVQGFRAFGKKLQRIDLSSCIAVLWGANSQGKTSLAEAFEFLLTGSIVRRELLASSQDEFADALRNAHIPADLPVFIEAEIVDLLGVLHHIKRTLLSDYTKKATCTSTLEIDGGKADQTSLAKLGIVLSQPPMAAPVLMQHTLAYLFSAKPLERSTYFKALLEVADLDALRAKIAEREPLLTRAESPVLAKLRTCANQPVLQPILAPLLETAAKRSDVAKALNTAATALLTAAGATSPATQAENLERIETVLAETRARTFPLACFDQKLLKPWEAPKQQSWDDLDEFIIQAKKIDAETKRLSALFAEVLKIPGVSEIEDPLTCPVCETPDALTSVRIAKIRDQLQASHDYRKTREAAQNALRQIQMTAFNLQESLVIALPQLFNLSGSKRKVAGFSIERMRVLLDTDHFPLVDTWQLALVSLARERRSFGHLVAAAAAVAKSYLIDVDTLRDSKR
jgi:DNA repair exonuclease SbcCD ATPase subunit